MTIANVQQAAAWDGHEGDMWTEHADRYEATGRRIWTAFAARRPIAERDHVLDIGCGTGKSTREAARLAPAGLVLGVDLSARMLGHARYRSAAQGLANVRFLQADAQVHRFGDGSFDVVISSFGTMFFADPVAAFRNIGLALRPGGRLAVLTWRELVRNQWLTVLREALALGRALPEPPSSVPGPFGLADPAHVRRVLGAAGFDGTGLEPIDELIEFGPDASAALSFVRTLGIVEGLTKGLDDQAEARGLENLHRVLEAHETGEGVLLGSSAWLITARWP